MLHPHKDTNYRNGSLFGVHRVLQPKGVLPQTAEKLDNQLPIFDNEVLIEVTRLNIDSASFSQMLGEARKKTRTTIEIGQSIAEKVLKNVHQQGKQVNSVTGSGGMLIGKVKEIGSAYQGPCALEVDDRIATLVSLTLTPLHLDSIDRVFIEGPREAQMEVKGHAILFSGAPVARLPSDLPEDLVLSALDVCGAPAQVERLVKPGFKILVLGAGGKSGLLCLAQVQKNWQNLGPKGLLMAIDNSPQGLKAIEHLGAANCIGQGNACDPLAIREMVAKWTAGEMADLVLNQTNRPHTEMAAILSAKSGGRVYFFNMATDFSRATLGAEGVGQDVELMMGNGYTPGHAELTLTLLRENKKLFEILRTP